MHKIRVRQQHIRSLIFPMMSIIATHSCYHTELVLVFRFFVQLYGVSTDFTRIIAFYSWPRSILIMLLILGYLFQLSKVNKTASVKIRDDKKTNISAKIFELANKCKGKEKAYLIYLK